MAEKMRSLSDMKKFPEDDETIDIDVCLGCGRYYGMTKTLFEAWRNSVNYRAGAVMDQLCLKCMEGNARCTGTSSTK